MFLPYDCDQPKHRVSLATHGLLMANVAILAYTLLATRFPQATILAWAFDPRHPSPVTFVGSVFMHAGLVHLLGNMLFLHVAGRPLEWRLGRGVFLGVYALCGAVANIAQALSSPTPSVGASGAIAGLLGAYLVLMPEAQVSMFWFLLGRGGTFAATALWLLLYWIGEQVAMAALTRGHSSVGYGAHIGGFVAGALVGVVIKNVPSLTPDYVRELLAPRRFEVPVHVRRRGSL